MTQANLETHILMHRPHFAHLPQVAPLPEGYALRTFAPDDDWRPLAHTLSLAYNYLWDENRVREKLIDAPDVKAIYVVTWRGDPVATTSSRWLPERFPQSGYVHYVGTRPDHQGKGLASALMARVLQDFMERDYKDAVLETADFRIPAIKIYLKFGFVPVYDVDEEDHRDRWSAIFQTIFGR